MQLVAMGAQDVYLTGNPQITFFKVVYRRHTNFSKECIEQTFSGSIPETGTGSVTCTLARNGDLVQEIYLKTTVEAKPSDSVESGNVTIGGGQAYLSVADAATGAWVATASADTVVYFTKDLYYDSDTSDSNVTATILFTANTRYKMTINNSNEATFKTMAGVAVGVTAGANAGISDSATTGPSTYSGKIIKEAITLDNSDMTDLIKTVEVEIGGQKIDKHYSQWLDIYNELFETSHDLRFAMTNGSQTAPNVNTKTHYIPLRFWFNRNPGLALPLIALQYHEVKINMTLNPARTAGTVTMSDAKLLVNYIYLDTDERRRFAQVSHEYLIEQVQHTGPETETTVDMNFNHPVKALFWTGSGAHSVALGAAKLQLNGHDRAAEQPHDYYHLVQPYESGLGHCGKSLNNELRTWGPVVNTGEHNNVGMYSFCLKPAEHQPSGTCNFSRIDNARLNIAGVSSNNKLYLFALNYNVLRIMSGMGGLAYSN